MSKLSPFDQSLYEEIYPSNKKPTQIQTIYHYDPPIRLTEIKHLKKLGDGDFKKFCRDCNHRNCCCLWSKLAHEHNIIPWQPKTEREWHVRRTLLDAFRENILRYRNKMLTHGLTPKESVVWILKPVQYMRDSDTDIPEQDTKKAQSAKLRPDGGERRKNLQLSSQVSVHDSQMKHQHHSKLPVAVNLNTSLKGKNRKDYINERYKQLQDKHARYESTTEIQDNLAEQSPRLVKDYDVSMQSLFLGTKVPRTKETRQRRRHESKNDMYRVKSPSRNEFNYPSLYTKQKQQIESMESVLNEKKANSSDSLESRESLNAKQVPTVVRLSRSAEDSNRMQQNSSDSALVSQVSNISIAAKQNSKNTREDKSSQTSIKETAPFGSARSQKSVTLTQRIKVVETLHSPTTVGHKAEIPLMANAHVDSLMKKSMPEECFVGGKAKISRRVRKTRKRRQQSSSSKKFYTPHISSKVKENSILSCCASFDSLKSTPTLVKSDAKNHLKTELSINEMSDLPCCGACSKTDVVTANLEHPLQTHIGQPQETRLLSSKEDDIIEQNLDSKTKVKLAKKPTIKQTECNNIASLETISSKSFTISFHTPVSLAVGRHHGNRHSNKKNQQ